VSSGPELVTRRARRAFREIAPAIVCREIDSIWQDEGFAPGPSNEETGERRNLYQRYLDSVDWTDAGHVMRALRAFEETARQVEPQYAKDAFDRLRADGYRVDDRGRVTGVRVTTLRAGALADLKDPSAIRDNLDRIQRAVADGDDAQAIGSAKELVESTAKVVLRELGYEPDPKDDLPALVTRAQTLLGVHPAGHTTGPDGSDAVRRILGGAITVATGLAELRNRGYGTGHGPAGPRTGLGPRHARLAVGAARLWCDFVLDTLADPAAPWRKTATTPSPGRAGA